jgi:SAM-dependent methyltransferase
MQDIEHDTIRSKVRAHYASIAEQNSSGCSCAPSSCCSGDANKSQYAAKLGYSKEELSAAPDGANLNLGCGNPLAIASIQKGETVLDLGSGAGFDCFLAARQLAGSGQVIGVDMTPEMVSKARRNAARSGYENVDFRLGEIEAMPVADAAVDLIISNCVINLSPNKPKVFKEAFRVLRKGGRLAISDVVASHPLPEAWKNDSERLAACIAGAETKANIEAWLKAAGFTDIRIVAKSSLKEIIDTWDETKTLGDVVVSAIIEARKP